MTVIIKMVLIPIRRFIETNLSNVEQDVYLKVALGGMISSFAIMHKASSSFRGWTKATFKFALYVALILGMCACSGLLALKLNMTRKLNNSIHSVSKSDRSSSRNNLK